VRLPVEDDRARFVELFCDDAFMVFSNGTLHEPEAHARFDRMLANGTKLTLAKQPVIERASGGIVGYVGVDWFEFEGEQRLEFGWRLVPEARGKGYATEASQLVLERAGDSFRGEILAIIDPSNEPSKHVATKVGFQYWKAALVNGYLDTLWRLELG
jgi:RimJ/RimL family protein N-acetyltransferase